MVRRVISRPAFMPSSFRVREPGNKDARVGASGRVQSGRAHAGARRLGLSLRQRDLAGAAQLIVELACREPAGEERRQCTLLAAAEPASGCCCLAHRGLLRFDPPGSSTCTARYNSCRLRYAPSWDEVLHKVK